MKKEKISTLILTASLFSNLFTTNVYANNLNSNLIGYNVNCKHHNHNHNKKLFHESMNCMYRQQASYKNSPNTIYQMTNKLAHQDVKQKMYSNGRFRNATEYEITQHLAINPRANSEQLKYQFLRLDSFRNVNASKLSRFLENKGVFRGHAEDFINAARMNNIDPIYLVSHAMLETGNGTSNLAKGNKMHGKTYYNFFGINAFDASPLYGGVSLAQKEDWSSVSKAIYGGARWISKNYIHSSRHTQRTIYEMRFDPLANDPWHIYATDLKWPDKISSIMSNISSFYNSSSIFDYEVIKYR